MSGSCRALQSRVRPLLFPWPQPIPEQCRAAHRAPHASSWPDFYDWLETWACSELFYPVHSLHFLTVNQDVPNSAGQLLLSPSEAPPGSAEPPVLVPTVLLTAMGCEDAPMGWGAGHGRCAEQDGFSQPCPFYQAEDQCSALAVSSLLAP